MLAEVASDVDFAEYVEQALLILFVLGGTALVLGNLIMGGSSVSSNSSRSRKYGPLQDSLDTSDDAKEQQSAAPAILAPRVTAGKKDRRKALRRKGNAVGVLFRTGPKARVEPALVTDRSKGGLCLSVPDPVAVGTTLHIRACQAPDDCPWIQVRVRHCAANEKRWHLGCQFVEELPWNVLLLFG